MENKCNSCFYALMDKDLEAPCVLCTGYSNYVKGDVYMSKTSSHCSKPLKEAIDDWFKENTSHEEEEDYWISYKGVAYDLVNKPKHYMLFEEEGIEVRDVLEKLVHKIIQAVKDDDYPQGYSTLMFIPDYVQMMQYLMRFMDKNGPEDLKKAKWYLDKLIDSYEHHV